MPGVKLSKGDVILFQGDSITDAGRKKGEQDAKSAGALGNGYPALIAGQLLAMLPIIAVGSPSDGLQIAAAFVLFRFFDITKLWPISRLERLHGGVGIMADDLAAGLAAAALLYAVLNWGWI